MSVKNGVCTLTDLPRGGNVLRFAREMMESSDYVEIWSELLGWDTILKIS
jgi:hypothetical protein